MGTAACSNEKSPFGIFFKDKIGQNVKHRNEDGDVDMSLSTYKSFVIASIQKKILGATIELSDYPTNYDVLIEHENDVVRCYEEMIKLTYYKSGLKVLITYNFDEPTEKKEDVAENILINNFSSVLYQTNKDFPENIHTQYLLIVGQMNTHSATLQWTFVVFDIYGSQLKRQIHFER